MLTTWLRLAVPVFLLLCAFSISYLNYADYGEQRAEVVAVLGKLHRVVI